MSGRRQRRAAIAVIAWILCCAAAGCAGWLEATRKHTYAPTFSYLTEEQLETTMWQLAAAVSELDAILDEDFVPTQGERLRVIELLTRMEQVSKALGPEDWPSNHPRVSRNVGRFRADLAAARRALQLEPPSYYRAGTIAGACIHCHQDE